MKLALADYNPTQKKPSDKVGELIFKVLIYGLATSLSYCQIKLSYIMPGMPPGAPWWW